jgi:hypothetical protein
LQNYILQELGRLMPLSELPPAELHEKAGACQVCHGYYGVPGITCEHCSLEKELCRWEAKLFRLSAKAMKSGLYVAHDTAVDQYYAEMMGNKGGLTLTAAERKHATIASVTLVHHDSEQHILLQGLVQLLRYPTLKPAVCASVSGIYDMIGMIAQSRIRVDGTNGRKTFGDKVADVHHSALHPSALG